MTSLIPRPKGPAEYEKYDVLEKIGHGSFGIIHKVRRKTDGLVLCRKEIGYSRMSTKEREQLSAELLILKELRHRNIVAYFEKEHLKPTQELHIYMEYCGNGDLGRYIKTLQLKQTYAPEDFVWSIFSQLVTALYRCHYGVDAPEPRVDALGFGEHPQPHPPHSQTVMILHRDLKPENVFLDTDNAVKLGDFGLSKVLRTQSFAETYVGTPFYMSPEIINGEKYTLYSDIWSLGCVIYELCALRPPFDAQTHVALISKISTGQFARIPPQYSEDLQDVINKCLILDPSKRPNTADLLTHPRVKLMRKELKIVEWASQLQKRADQIEMKARALQNDIEARVKRQCETQCQTEHSRMLENAKKDAIRTLQSQFDAEVQRRVAQEVEIHITALRREYEQRLAMSGNSISDHDSTAPTSSNKSSRSSNSTAPDLNQLVSKQSGPAGKTAAMSRIRASSAVPSLMDVAMLDPPPAAAAAAAAVGLSPRRAISIPNLASPGNEQQPQSGLNRYLLNNLTQPSFQTFSNASETDLPKSFDAEQGVEQSPMRPAHGAIRAVQSQQFTKSNLPKLKPTPSFLENLGGQGPGSATTAPATATASTAAGRHGFVGSRRPLSIIPTAGGVPGSPTRRVLSPHKHMEPPHRPAPVAPVQDGPSDGRGFMSKRNNGLLRKPSFQAPVPANPASNPPVTVPAQLARRARGGIRSASATLPTHSESTSSDRGGGRGANAGSSGGGGGSGSITATAGPYAEPVTWDPDRHEVMPSPFVHRQRRSEDAFS